MYKILPINCIWANTSPFEIVLGD